MKWRVLLDAKGARNSPGDHPLCSLRQSAQLALHHCRSCQPHLHPRRCRQAGHCSHGLWGPRRRPPGDGVCGAGPVPRRPLHRCLGGRPGNRLPGRTLGYSVDSIFPARSEATVAPALLGIRLSFLREGSGYRGRAEGAAAFFLECLAALPVALLPNPDVLEACPASSS